MNKIITATIMAALTALGVNSLMSQDVPAAASAATAVSSITTLAHAAWVENELGSDWDTSLATAHANLRNGADELTIDGTQITWRLADACFTAYLPTPDTDISVDACQ